MDMRLLWLDLETSGLEPDRCAILEIAVGLADLRSPFDLSTIDRFVLRFTGEHTLSALCKLRLTHQFDAHEEPDSRPCPVCAFDPVARAMHEKSGLLAECAISTTTVGEVEEFLLTLVDGEPGRGDDKPTLAGSSVHFDRGFLRAQLPRFAARLSHRHYDVSAVKLFCESLGMPRIPKAEAHRAVDDIQESIAHARRCVRWLQSELFGGWLQSELFGGRSAP
jgi:oligoribonuclease